MNEHEVLSRINVLLQKIASDAVAAVNAEAPGWDQLVVSVKWADDDTGVFDTIIESTHGDKKKYHFAPISNDLIDLWDVSRHLEKPWNELVFFINADGTCKTKFEYP